MVVAITSVYSVIAVCTPVTVVPTSLATWAMDTFITELSSVIRNCADARVIRTSPAPATAVSSPPRGSVRAMRGRSHRRDLQGSPGTGEATWRAGGPSVRRRARDDYGR